MINIKWEGLSYKLNLLHHSQCHTQVIIPGTESQTGHDGGMMRTEALVSHWSDHAIPGL